MWLISATCCSHVMHCTQRTVIILKDLTGWIYKTWNLHVSFKLFIYVYFLQIQWLTGVSWCECGYCVQVVMETSKQLLGPHCVELVKLETLLNKLAWAGLECKKTRGLKHEVSALEPKSWVTIHHCKYISLLFLHVDRLKYLGF